MKDVALIAGLFAVYGGMIVMIAVMLVFLDKVNKLLRGFRKLISALPPYPVLDAETGDMEDKTRVEVQETWDENSPGLS